MAEKATSLPALPDPTTTAVTVLVERCAMVAEWAAEQTDTQVLDEARKWLAALEVYLARKGQAGPAQTAGRLTEARIGELLRKFDRDRTLGHDERSQFRQMAEHRAAWQAGLPLSRRAVMRKVRRVIEAEKAAAAPPVVEHAAGQTYRTIVIDPPWDPTDEGDVDQMGRAQPLYATMPIDKVRAMPVPDLADPDGCHLYLWITNRSLPKGFGLLEAWGFRYVTVLTWCKPSIGIGNYFRNNTEHVLFGIRGRLPLLVQDVGTWFQAPRGPRHSAKPDDFYSLVARCSPSPRLDVFGRGERDGFAVWGSEMAA